MSGRKPIYDWAAVKRFYDAGHSKQECQARFGFSNGAWHRAAGRGDIELRNELVAKSANSTRSAVAALLESGFTQADIAQQLGISRPTVCFHARRLGVAARVEFARRYDWATIRAAYDAGESARDCRRRFGFSRAAWADAVRRGAIELRPRLEPLDDVLASGRRRNRNHVKRRIFLAGLKQEACEGCGLTSWLGKQISLELHHVNGDGDDNRLDNLRLLCPNCHSQTDTWGGRNARRQAA